MSHQAISNLLKHRQKWTRKHPDVFLLLLSLTWLKSIFFFLVCFMFLQPALHPPPPFLQISAPSHSAVSRLVSRQSPLLTLSPCSFSLLPLQWLHQLQPQPVGTSCCFEEISHSVQLLVKAWHSNYDSSHLLWYGRDTACIFIKLDRWSDLRKPRSVKNSHYGVCAENKKLKEMQSKGDHWHISSFKFLRVLHFQLHKSIVM